MGEQKYRLEENNHTNDLILWENEKIINVFKNSYDNRKHLNIIVGRLNEQQATIDKQKIIIEERYVANERLNRFLIEIGLEKEYIKWEFKKGVLNE